MPCWEAAHFIRHAVVCGLLSLPALTASQCLFTRRKYDRLYIYLSVCLRECACVEAAGRKGGGCMWGCRDWRYSMYREVENGGAGTRLGSQQNVFFKTWGNLLFENYHTVKWGQWCRVWEQGIIFTVITRKLRSFPVTLLVFTALQVTDTMEYNTGKRSSYFI